MTGERSARRYPALAFPEIRAVRLAPIGASAKLVNLSATGVLVECADRAVPGTPLTVLFDGAFTPPSVESRVIRCEVTGIAADGTLRFHIGLAFDTRITLRQEADESADEAAPSASVPSPAPASGAAPAPALAAAAPASPAPIPRNRW